MAVEGFETEAREHYFDFMEQARHEEGVAKFDLVDDLVVELQVLATLQDKITDGSLAEIAFFEKPVYGEGFLVVRPLAEGHGTQGRGASCGQGINWDEEIGHSYSASGLVMALWIRAPITAPTTGATRKTQSWFRAQPPWKMAVPMERAGLTEVLLTGMEIK